MIATRAAIPIAAMTMLLGAFSGPVDALPPPADRPPATTAADGPFHHAAGVRPQARDDAAADAATTARLDVHVLDRAGHPPSVDQSWYVLVLGVDDMSDYTTLLEDGSATVDVPPGTYSLAAFVLTPEPDGRVSRTLAVDPSVEVTGDATAVLDASRAERPVRVGTDRRDAALARGLVLFSQPGPGGPGSTWHPWYAFDMDPTGLNYVTPTERVPGSHLYVYSSLARTGAASSPWSYNLVDASADRVPATPSYSHRTRDLARLRSTVAAQGEPGCARLLTDTRLPGEYVGMGGSTVTGLTPGVHTSYFTPGPQDWRLGVEYSAAGCHFGTDDSDWFYVSRPFPRAAGYDESWNAAPLGPALAGHDTAPAPEDAGWWGYARREGDRLVFGLPLLADSGAGHYGGDSAFSPYAGTTGSTRLSRDGRELGRTDLPGAGDFTVGPERATYRLDTELTRSVPWSDLATRQEVSWGFATSHDDGGVPDQLPLLAVRYALDLDDHGRAPAGRPYEFGVRVESWPGAPVGTVDGLTVEASYDDGATWHGVPLTAAADGWTASLVHPQGARYVSLRAHAEDSAGNTVDQTIVRGYGLAS